MAQAKQNITIDGRRIAFSNPDKILYPEANFTKKQVLDYYVRVSRFLLPHLKNRPITMLRYPDGVRGEYFYEKNAPRFTPEWIETFEVPSRGRRSVIRYILVNDLPTLVWLANLASLEIHPFLHRFPDISRPTNLVFDLDPGTGSDILTCGRVAVLLRELMAELGLESFAKVSGSKGLQVYIPLNTPVTYDVTPVFAKGIARLMEEREPGLIVSKMTKSLRAGKVLIDWSQNSAHKTTVSVYSLRGKSGLPYVSMPVSWEELSSAIGKGDASRLYWDAGRALKRLKKEGDLFQPLLEIKQKLPAEIAERLGNDGTESVEAEGPLRRYRHKRDFSASAEPTGRQRRARTRGRKPRFVVQKHAARRMHYDFRLESGGVLWSWAVPKGPPFRKGEKRLAVHVEDHPVDYLDFEGIIPKGQYGGGTVMVWDIGPYEMLEENLRKGHIRVRLHGSKLSGEWLLTRTRIGEEEKGENWLMIKAGESATPPAAEEDDRSAISGRSIEQIAGSGGVPSADKAAAARWKEQHTPSHHHRLNSLPVAKFEFQKPMSAMLTGELPREDGWAFEIKLDGYRALALRSELEVQLLSRRGNSLNRRFPEIAAALERMPPGTIVDGEIVALDQNGRTSFPLLQKSQKDKPPIYFYLFDLLAIGGKDLRKKAYSERRDLLERHVINGLSNPIRLSEMFLNSADKFLAAAKKLQAEGVIAKRLDSKYESGERSTAWLKYKIQQSQEMVIGGYIPGSNKFDALLVGYYSRDGLQYVAKVRNGFVPWLRRKVAEKFHGLESKKCPFGNLPEPAGRRGALTKEAMKSCRWLKPELVAQIEFAEWTSADRLRNAHFAGLRDDKDASEVVRERPVKRGDVRR